MNKAIQMSQSFSSDKIRWNQYQRQKQIFSCILRTMSENKEALVVLGINNYFFEIINNIYPCDPD